jgi:hypothetical protein
MFYSSRGNALSRRSAPGREKAIYGLTVLGASRSLIDKTILAERFTMINSFFKEELPP